MAEGGEERESREAQRREAPDLPDYFTRSRSQLPDLPDYFMRGWPLWPDILGLGREWSRLVPEPWRRSMEEGLGSVRVEEFMEDGQFVVRAELPGIDPDKDLDISVSHGALRIRAERRQESETKEKAYYRSELRYGAFDRSVPLPSGADEPQVKATYKDGILEVRVPVKDEKQAKKVQVDRG